MKKTILFFVLGSAGTKAQLNMARSIGAQIRNAKLQDGGKPEKCDYVAGEIPACYKDKPIFETAKDMSNFLDDDSAIDPAGDVEGEITRDKLEALTKDNLIAFADENEIELTKDDKKNKGNLVDAITDHLEID